MSSKKQFKSKSVLRFFRRQKRRLKTIAKHPSFYVPFITIVGLLIISFSLFYFFRNSKTLKINPNLKIVIISYDHIQRIVPTEDKTVGVLINKLGIILHPGDVVEPSLNAPINQDDFRINIYRAEPVAIRENNQVSFLLSAAKTPRAIVDQSKINIYPADYVIQSPSENFVTSGIIGSIITIIPATPVDLSLYGHLFIVRTHAKTVAQFLNEEGIKPHAGDQLSPSLSTSISANLPILINKKGVKISVQSEVIPMPIQTIYDNNLAFGTSAIRQQGANGQEVITYQDNLINNQVVSQTELQTVVTIQPVSEIVVEGTSLSGIEGDMALAGISPNDYNYASYIISHESGWCPTKAQGEHYCPAVPDNAYTPYGYGLCQATPGYKMASAGSDWATDPITQLEWCNGYAMSHYGGWYNAYIHWINYRWW